MTQDEVMQAIHEDIKSLMVESRQTHDDVVAIKVVLKGYNGDEGLLDRVAHHSKEIKRVWIVLTALTVSSGGGYGLLKLLG